VSGNGRCLPDRLEDDYVRVEAWLERELGVSGLVDLAAEGPVQFAHIKMLMSAIVCAGQPSIAFRVLR
jgi:hypothetical protein